MPTESHACQALTFSSMERVDTDFLFVGEGGVIDPLSLAGGQVTGASPADVDSANNLKFARFVVP